MWTLPTAGILLLAIAIAVYLRFCCRSILQLQTERRPDLPPYSFSKLFRISRRHQKHRFPASGLQRQAIYGFAITWLFALSGLVLLAAWSTGGSWPR